MPRAKRFLVAVAGTAHLDVAPAVVTRRLDVISVSMDMCDIAWSLLHLAHRGVPETVAAWAFRIGVETAVATDHHDMLANARWAAEDGWAVRLEAFPGRYSPETYEAVNLWRGAGFLTTYNGTS